jgi:DNA-binding transcriptional regulator of glucitol operon
MNKRIVARTVLVSVVFMIAFSVYAYFQLYRYEDGMAEIYAEEQDGYVALVVDKIKSGDTVVAEAQETVELLKSADDHYWTLDNRNTILYIKNVTETNVYRNVSPDKYYKTKSARNFIENMRESEVNHKIIVIDDKKYIASGTIINVGGEKLRMILLTDYHILFTNNEYLSNKIYLEIAIIAVAIIFVVTLIMMAIYIGRQNDKIQGVIDENKKLAEKIERLISIEAVRNAVIDNAEAKRAEREAEKANVVTPAQVTEEAAPVEEEASPVVEEAAPVVEEAAPVVEEATPVLEEPITQVEEEIVEEQATQTPLSQEEMDKESDILYANSKILRGTDAIDKLFDGMVEREIFPTTVLACRLRGISAADFFLQMKDIVKRDAVWVELNEGDLLLVFANRRKKFVMDFVWKYVVYQDTVRAYKVFSMEDKDKVAETLDEINGFYRG